MFVIVLVVIMQFISTPKRNVRNKTFLSMHPAHILITSNKIRLILMLKYHFLLVINQEIMPQNEN